MKSYQIYAKVEGKTWLTRSTTLKANNESDAINKAKIILRLTDEHEIKVTPCKVHHINSKLKTDNYPYGRNRTTAFFSVEMNAKGCRTVFQTIDPKNGRLNNPKKSTYYNVILPVEMEDNFFDFCGYLDFNGTESINKGLYFMEDYKDCFNAEQIKQITTTILTMTKVNAKAQIIYCGSKWEDLKPYFEKQIQNLVSIINGDSDNFLDSLFDVDKIESLKDPNYQPFKVTSYNIA